MRTSEGQLKLWMVGGLEGDAVAHAALLSALVPLLRNFYRRRIRDAEDDIEDLVQETLIAVHTRRATYDRDRIFTAWLYAIARYKMIDHFRRNRSHVPIDSLADILSVEGFEGASNARLDVEQLLCGLPAKQADAIRHTHIDGQSGADAADLVGISLSDLKISIHRGMKTLSAKIAGDRS